jgi:UDP-glucose 4-epimerase
MARAPNGKFVLVTGGAGYIGSHSVLELMEAGYGVTVVDSLVNAVDTAIDRIKEITGKPDQVEFVQADLMCKTDLVAVFEAKKYECVIHFAALKAVGESVQKPILYYQNNIYGTTVLLEVMEQFECRSLVFSSSATVYGDAPIPYTEDSQPGLGITSPYGQTKYMIEQILKDVTKVNNSKWKVVCLRYFNPIGAHPSGRIGEDPSGIPNNLMPFIAQVCVGRREFLTVFGDDFDTPDGTCLRDYIHVVDLALGHVAALKRLDQEGPFWEVFNLGSGKPVSVLEMVHAMGKAVGKDVPYKMGARRAGDLPKFWADPKKAKELLGWETKKTLAEMCEDTWRWQSNNPMGYKEVVEKVDETGYHEKKLKVVKKEGGKKGAELAGAADMGGIEYFTTVVDTPEGDPRLVEIVCQEMNADIDPQAEETKGGSKHVAKMLLSSSDAQLALVAYVPADKANQISPKAWMEHMFSALGCGEFVGEPTAKTAVGICKQDSAKGKFPVKMRDEGIGASIALLKSKGLFPDKDDDSSDEMVFGDDDFPDC